jgi:hypothetical protein
MLTLVIGDIWLRKARLVLLARLVSQDRPVQLVRQVQPDRLALPAPTERMERQARPVRLVQLVSQVQTELMARRARKEFKVRSVPQAVRASTVPTAPMAQPAHKELLVLTAQTVRLAQPVQPARRARASTLLVRTTLQIPTILTTSLPRTVPPTKRSRPATLETPRIQPQIQLIGRLKQRLVQLDKPVSRERMEQRAQPVQQV